MFVEKTVTTNTTQHKVNGSVMNKDCKSKHLRIAKKTFPANKASKRQISMSKLYIFLALNRLSTHNIISESVTRSLASSINLNIF